MDMVQPEQKSPAIADNQKQTSPSPTRPQTAQIQQQNQHEKVKLKEINPYLTCRLCKGYLIDATTISECLHSFCRSCIIKFLEENSYCPVCEVIINKAKPNLKLDKTLQDIVYKLVPGLFLAEMLRRKRFYAERPGEAARVSPEQRGEDTERTIFNPQDRISLSLEYIGDAATSGRLLKDLRNSLDLKSDSTQVEDAQVEAMLKRYLQCPGMCRIDVIKKFIRNKYNVNTDLFQIDILYKRVPLPLPDHYTLIDVAYIYTWKRNEPMRFYFRIIDKGNDELPDLTKVFTPIESPLLLRPHARSTPTKKLSKVLATPDAKERKKRPVKKTNSSRKLSTPKPTKKEDCDKDLAQSEIKIAKESVPDKTPEKCQVSPSEPLEKVADVEVKKEVENEVSPVKKVESEVSPVEKVENEVSPVKKEVYTNITLNRTNNLEIITEIRKMSNKGQSVGVNIINQTVKKTNVAEVQNGTSATPTVKVETNCGPVVKTENPIPETVVKQENVKSEFVDHEMEQKKFEFLKSIELTSKKVVDNLAKLINKQQAKIAVKAPVSKPCFTPPLPNPVVGVAKTKKLSPLKQGGNGVKRKTSSPSKNEAKKQKTEAKKTTKIIIQQKPGFAAINPAARVAEKNSGQNKNDLHSLFQNCRLNIPSSLSITLKENGETSRSPLPMAPVQNYIEILKIDEKEGKKAATVKKEDSKVVEVDKKKSDSNTVALPKTSPCSQPKETLTKAQLQQQSFQKIFEESIKKPDGDGSSEQVNGGVKRNILDIAQQLYKKTKVEQGNAKVPPETLPRCATPMPVPAVPAIAKVPIPRLNNQRVIKPPKRNHKYEISTSQTLKNLHSTSLGLNYTVSVGKQSTEPVKQTYKLAEPVQSSPKTPELKIPARVTASPKSGPSPRDYSAKTPQPSSRDFSAKTPQPSPKPRSSAASPKPAQSAGSSAVSSSSSPALTPNQLLEKYNIQNLAQLSASINFNAASVPQSYLNAVQGTQMAALHQAMLLKQYELQNRQKWLNINQGPLLQFEKYLQSLNASKNKILGNIKDN